MEKLKAWRRQLGPAGVVDRHSRGPERLRVSHLSSISLMDLEGQGFQSGIGDVLTTQVSLEGLYEGRSPGAVGVGAQRIQALMFCESVEKYFPRLAVAIKGQKKRYSCFGCCPNLVLP